MRVVVAGGTGFLGRHITDALRKAGHDVSVMSRTPHRVGAIPQLRDVKCVFGDVTDPFSLRGSLDGADAVVASVQFPNYPMELPRRGLTFDRYDRYGTTNLLDEAERARVGRFFYVSGAGADPASDQPWYRAKGRAEEAIRAGSLHHAILRPSWAYGPEDKALNKFVRIARVSPLVPKPAPMQGLSFVAQRIQPVWVGDIARAAARIFSEESQWDRTYEIGGPEVMTMTEVIRTMLSVLGKKRAIVPVPAPLMKIATAPLVLLPKPPLTPGGVEFAVQNGLVDLTELRTRLGIEPLALHEGLSRYLRARS